MKAEKRNARVVVALIGSLTVGASVLLWMEPRPGSADGGNQSSLLAATELRVEIAYRNTLTGVDHGSFDGVILPDGRWEPWGARGSIVRLLVIGSGGTEISHAQKERLLELLRWFNQNRGLDLRNVSLDPRSDYRVTPGLPAEARELAKFLATKGLLR